MNQYTQSYMGQYAPPGSPAYLQRQLQAQAKELQNYLPTAQPLQMQFVCIPITNLEELRAMRIMDNMPVIGTAFLQDRIYVKNPDGSIDTYTKHDEPPQATSNQAYITSSDLEAFKTQLLKELTNYVQPTIATSNDGDDKEEPELQPSNAGSSSAKSSKGTATNGTK